MSGLTLNNTTGTQQQRPEEGTYGFFNISLKGKNGKTMKFKSGMYLDLNKDTLGRMLAQAYATDDEGDLILGETISIENLELAECTLHFPTAEPKEIDEGFF